MLHCKSTASFFQKKNDGKNATCSGHKLRGLGRQPLFMTVVLKGQTTVPEKFRLTSSIMSHVWLLVAGMFALVQGQLDMCSFLPRSAEVDWSKMRSGPWRWAAYTPDEFQDTVVCSKMTIRGVDQPGNQSFTMDMQYGPWSHQVHTMKGTYVNRSEYHITDFANSWRNIMIYNKDKEAREKILSGEVEIERKGNVVFYTDYKNFIVNTICMPDGRVSVSAFTVHTRVTRLLMKRIYSLLYKYKVLTIPVKAVCEETPRTTAKPRASVSAPSLLKFRRPRRRRPRPRRQ